MRVEQLKDLLGAKVLNEGVDLSGEVKSAYLCDLLSWVMAKGAPGTAWVTVMTHLNVIAVATLLDMACVIIPENIAVEPATLQKATQEDIPVLACSKTAFELAGLMHAQGLGDPVK